MPELPTTDEAVPPPGKWLLWGFLLVAVAPIGVWSWLMWRARGLAEEERLVLGLAAGYILPLVTWGGAVLSLALGLDLRRRSVGWRRTAATLGLVLGCAPAALWVVGAVLIALLGWSVGV